MPGRAIQLTPPRSLAIRTRIQRGWAPEQAPIPEKVCAGIVDTGSERTIVPLDMLADLGVEPCMSVIVYDWKGNPSLSELYWVRVALDDWGCFSLPVLACIGQPPAIGWDVLGQFRCSLLLEE